MNPREGGLRIRRILVALDSSRHSLAALEAAGELAAHTEAELLGLFVEDINLLRLAKLPFASQVSWTARAAESVDSARMERELRAQAEQARQALAAVAGRLRVPWSFRVVRGEVAAEVLAAAEKADLLTLGKRGLALSGQRLGSTAHAALTRLRRPLLLSQHGSRLRQPVLVVYDGSEGSRQALNVALGLAPATGPRLLIVFLVDEASKPPHELREEVGRVIELRGCHVRYQGPCRDNAVSLSHALGHEPEGLLVLSDAGRLSRGEIQKLLQQVANPVLLIAGTLDEAAWTMSARFEGYMSRRS
jgi:nucleotide-binding universal stress UspA family protein